MAGWLAWEEIARGLQGPQRRDATCSKCPASRQLGLGGIDPSGAAQRQAKTRGPLLHLVAVIGSAVLQAYECQRNFVLEAPPHPPAPNLQSVVNEPQ